jgi:choline dehydrogenase-like flavoprotein
MVTPNGVNGVNGDAPTAHVSADEFRKTDFDYLVCGGGTAGVVVAARLSENPDVTVGLIEAGKNRLGDAVVDTPLLFTQMFGNSEYAGTIRQLRKRATTAKSIMSCVARCSVAPAALIT